MPKKKAANIQPSWRWWPLEISNLETLYFALHPLPPTVNFPRLSIAPPTPSPRPQNDPDALAQGKIRFHDCNDKMIFVSDWILAKMSKKPYNKQKKFEFCRKIGAKFQTKAQNSPKVHLFWEIWGAIHSTKIPTGLTGKLWSTSKGGPIFSKLFWLDRTDPLSFGPKFLKILG